MSTISTSSRAPSEPPTTAQVVVAVIVVGDLTPAALSAVRRQGYGTAGTVLIGGGTAGEALAAAEGIPHLPSIGSLVASLDPSVDLVWIVHGDAVPRPDALSALVSELERNDASVAGSKILDAHAPDRLESVGGATDMFGEIYLGLDPGEVDLEQYDVVREVAFVSGVSLLIRRDLLKGLGGLDPRLPPVAAGLDLSQRARIAGGRVIVVPSSEAHHARVCREDVSGWRELAGRMRAMLKAYRLMTLLWLVPAGVVVGIGDGLVRLLLGQWRPLATYFAALGWSIAELPSTLRERSALAPVRHVGDEELFRFQTSGSVRLRNLASDLGGRLGWIVDEEPGVVTEEELESEASLLGPLVATLVLLVLGVAGRGVVLGSLPAARFSAPLGSDPGAVLAAYAGGWNPAGLGSPESPHPGAAAAAALQWVTGGWTGVTALITAAALVAGAFGSARLLHRLGVSGPSRWLTVIPLFLGPFASLVAAAGHWPGLIALAAAPWAATIVLTPATGHRRGRLGKAGSLVAAGAALGAWSPGGLVVPLVVAVVAWAVLPETGARVLARGGLASLAGLLVASPFLLGSVPRTVVGTDPVPYGLPDPAVLALLGIAGVVAVLGTGSRPALLGLALSAVGLGALAVPDIGGEGRVAAAVVGSLGAALVVGAAFAPGGDGRRALAGRVAAGVAAAGVLVFAGGAVAGGRLGLPPDEWGSTLEFATALAADPAAEHVLLVGAPEDLPGSVRIGGDGYAYRVVDAEGVSLDDLWLGSPRSADRELAAALGAIGEGGVTRPGALLAGLGVRWVVVLDDGGFADRLVAQMDLAEVPLAPGVRVFESTEPVPAGDADLPPADGARRALAVVAAAVPLAGIIASFLGRRRS